MTAQLMKHPNKDRFETSEFVEWEQQWTAFGLLREEQQFISLLSKDGVVLEVGCGGGRIAQALKQLGFTHIIGLDYVFRFTQHTKCIIDHVINADAVQLPLATASLDYVIAWQQLISLINTRSDRQQFLRECYRVMRPNGLLLLSALDFAGASRSRKVMNQLLRILRTSPIYSTSEDRLLPWLRKGGRPNWRFLLPNEPLVYWYLSDELRQDVEEAGFSVQHLRSNGALYCVAAKQPAS